MLRKMAIWFSILIVSLLIGCGTGKDSSKEFIIAIQNNNIDIADSLYEEIIESDDDIKQKVIQCVLEQLELISQKYYNGEITYNIARDEIDKYERYVPFQANEYLDKIDILKESKANFEIAEKLYKTKKYLEAKDYYEKVITEDSNYEQASKISIDCYRLYADELLENIKDAVNKQEYEYAINRIESEKINLNSDDYSQIIQIRDDIIDLYIENIINKAFEMVEERRAADGFEIVSTALDLYPNNVELKQTLELILDYLPMYLDQESYVATDFEVEYHLNGSFDTADTSGNRYKNANYYWTSSFYSDTSQIKYDTYFLNKEYSHFTATLAPECAWIDDPRDEGTEFFITGDNEVLFNSYITKNSEPCFIDIDISGVENLKIGMQGGNTVRILLADPYLYKRY